MIFTRDIEPRLGKRVLGELTADECWDAVYDKAKASRVRANKTAGELSGFLRWCASRGHAIIACNVGDSGKREIDCRRI